MQNRSKQHLLHSSSRIHLTLFFTRGVSLRTWEELGMFEREVALYRKFQAKGMKVSFVTYGDERDLKYAPRIPGIDILCNSRPEKRLPFRVYAALIPIIHAKILRKSNVIKSNQTAGAEIAQRAAKFWRKPFIARSGWMWSFNEARRTGQNSQQTLQVLELEKKIFSKADRIIVTTSAMRESILKIVPSSSKKAWVIPNYVDDAKFRPLKFGHKRHEIIFVGRLSPEKNIEQLLRAVVSSDIKAMFIGQGPLEQLMMKMISSSQGRIYWKKRIPSNDLPFYFNQAKLFVLPSLYENHPKSLIEAMSCGLPVLGADSPGIRDIIQHGVNGWLCDTDSESIRISIEYMLNNQNLCKKLGNNARTFVIKHFSLEQIVEKELELIKEIVKE